MTRLILKATTLAVCASGLAACATPSYPVRAGYAAPAPIEPKYAVKPTTSPPPSTAAAAPEAAPAGEARDAAESPAPPVQSQALPPVAGPAGTPAPTPQTAPAASTPSPPPVAEPEPPAAPPPQTSYEAPAPRTHTTPARLVAGGQVVEAKGMYRVYVVQKHDHLDAIARDLQTTRQELVDANQLKAPYGVIPGQRLKIPVAKAYVAETGDTLGDVARRFDVGVAELSDLNNLPERGRLSAGTKIALPANYSDHGPIRLATAPAAEAPPPRPSRYYAPSYASAPSSGPYVPSAAALAAGAAHRNAQAAAAGSSASSSTAYAPPRSAAAAPPPPTQASVIAAGKGRFVWPLHGEVISGFGVTGVGRRNDGVDIRSSQGTVVHAAAAGEVVYAGNQVPGFGNLVLVKHADGWVTAYAHLDRISVQMRQTVVQGQELGSVGMSGGVTEAQLHFEVRYASSPADKARPIDPIQVLPQS